MEVATTYAEFHPAAILAVVALIVAFVGTIADRRRSDRRDINSVGFMPWRGIVVAAIFIALISAVYAFKN